MMATTTCPTSQNTNPTGPAVQRFEGLAEQIGAARAWALGCLPAGCPRRDDVALVLSELVTNAVLHSASGTPGGQVEIRVDVEADAVALSVLDQGPTLAPAVRGPGEHGRGLGIVGALVDAYDVTTTEAGRCTWCRLDWSPVPAQTRTERAPSTSEHGPTAVTD